MDESKKLLDQVFAEKRKGGERRIKSTLSRGSERRRLNLGARTVGEKLTRDVSKLEGTLQKVPKSPITQEISKPPRPSGYFKGGGQGMRYGTLKRATAAAEGYLAKKAARSTIGSAIKLGAKAALTKVALPLTIADTAYETGKTAYGLYQLNKAHRQEKEAKQGAAWIKSEMAKRKK